MIHFILLQNRFGRTRLARWYGKFDASERSKIEIDVHRTVIHRDRRWSSFTTYEDFRLVMRQYAGLYFVFGVDPSENEIALYEAIHLLVEALDTYFGNVCELDLIFNFNKAYSLLDDVILAGEVYNTHKQYVVDRQRERDRLA